MPMPQPEADTISKVEPQMYAHTEQNLVQPKGTYAQI